MTLPASVAGGVHWIAQDVAGELCSAYWIPPDVETALDGPAVRVPAWALLLDTRVESSNPPLPPGEWTVQETAGPPGV
jgi:hypothetical protein